MSHLDDGFLTAYLDGQTVGRSDGQQHLGECAECQARLEALRITRERAQAILRSGTPSGSQPAFQEILRRRQKAAEGGRRIVSPRSLAWAASIMLALSVGWYTREMQLRPSAPSMVVLSARETTTTDMAGETGRTGGAAIVATAQPRQLAEAAPPPVMRAARDDEQPSKDLARAKAAAQPASVANENRLEKKVAEAPALALGDLEAKRETNAAAPVPAAVTAPQTVAALSATTQWTSVNLIQATRALGRAPVQLPGAEVVGYAARANGPSGVQVMQRLPTGGLIEVVQEPVRTLDAMSEVAGQARRMQAAAGARADAGLRAETGVRAVVGGLDVRISGSVSDDSLRVLLRKLK